MENAQAAMAQKFLIGQDLAGNTFWEFKDQINHNRFRRIVHYRRGTHHSDVQVSPQWHQWLRQTRVDPPTLQEQAADVQRQTQLKYNARLADERWAAKAKYIEKPKPPPASKPVEDGEEVVTTFEKGPNISRGTVETTPKTADRKTDPWKQADDTGSNPGANWQPEAWTPGASGTKR